MQGKIHIYTGDGKGKTTAAVGLAVRAVGRNKRVALLQFLKDTSSGEIAPLRQLGVTVRGLADGCSFVWNMQDDEKQQVRAIQNQMLQTVLEEYQESQWDLIILDEIMAACQNQLADETLVDTLLASKPLSAELVLTGRQAPQKWIAQADYVTEMTCLKHPYEPAREGIEY